MMQTETENQVNPAEEIPVAEEQKNSSAEEKNSGGKSEENPLEKELKEAAAQIASLKDQYVRLLADFDNFRKRTAKEKSELIRTASEEVMLALLPVLDDFERTLASTEKTENLASIKEGIRLVTGNFFKALHKKGLEQIQCVGLDFDSNYHEAITSISAGEEKKGKVIDEVEKGYMLGDKVIRFAKVVIGE